MKIADLLRSIEMRLPGRPRLEAELLVIHSYQTVGRTVSRTELLLEALHEAPPEVARHALAQARHRAEGYPLQYLIGTQSFFDLEYSVGPGVLIPRPETELMVETAVQRLKNRPTAPTLGIEVGIGSGAISIELLIRFPALTLIASELSPQALHYAKENRRRHLSNPERLRLIQVKSSTEVLEPFEAGDLKRADFLISNPPYLDPSALEAMRDVVQHEPHEALFAPAEDALYFYRKIAHGPSPQWVFLELPHERAEAIERLFTRAGWRVEIVLDFTHRPRILIAERTSTHFE